MNWNSLAGDQITDLDFFPVGVVGFIYLIEYTDGSMYIGKKNFFSVKTVAALKSGEARPNAVRINRRIYQSDTGKSKLMPYDKITTESNWKEYEGSTKRGKAVANKTILATATSKGQLTYLETKYLFKYDVLNNTDFINDNILGKFYRGRV